MMQTMRSSAKGQSVVRNSSKALAAIGLLALLLGVGAETGLAHPLDPALLEIWERGDRTLDVLWRLPALQPIGSVLQPVFPAGCTDISSRSVSSMAQSVIQRWRVDCRPQNLVDRQIGVQGLRERRTDALVRVHLADGQLIQAVLRGDVPNFRVPERSGLSRGCAQLSGSGLWPYPERCRPSVVSARPGTAGLWMAPVA